MLPFFPLYCLRSPATMDDPSPQRPHLSEKPSTLAGSGCVNGMQVFICVLRHLPNQSFEYRTFGVSDLKNHHHSSFRN
ncbi:hypothetical protein KY285_029040 [Solanum tuberosum]|nr:hypothetical protein KY285_029040 [Solanum tuberosum]